MSWLKSLAGLTLAAFVAACGFVPIAADRGPTGTADDLVVRDIQIVAEDERFAYQMRRDLLQWIRIDPEARYALSAEATIATTSLAITSTDEITRLNYEASSRYRLIGIGDDPVVAGETSSIASVNATTDTFATDASERAAIRRLASDTARKIITELRVISLRQAQE